jgi:SAM-dependent methyltransferase
MAYETTKTKKLWGELEHSVLKGEGLDIGCGPDPVFPEAMPFDVNDGDANRITDYIKRQFDFVYSSHCLEHMIDAKAAIQEWWQLVKPGGVLFILVPDEDLYEQGFWPSRFNRDHKWTFTIAKQKSWSPVSINLFDLASSLPNGEIISIRLQDSGYERYLLSNGYLPGSAMYRLKHIVGRLLYPLLRLLGLDRQMLRRYLRHPIDQTVNSETLAQIQCVIRKKA